MAILIKTLQVILALSVLIFLHELGHFMWARLFGIRVDKFYLFFDIGGKALFRFRKGDTEYGVGWLPLGGYCKIAGMIDESMDMEQMKREPQAWEFRTHPAWQRLLVMAGGVLNNFIFAILVYIGIMAGWGESFMPNRDAQIYVDGLAQELGFRSGDHIIAFDDREPDDFFMLQAELVRSGAQFATVKRGGDTLKLYIDRSRIPEMLNTPYMFSLAVPFVVDSVATDGPNSGCELKRGDRLLCVDGHEIAFLQDSWEVLKSHKGEVVGACVLRGEDSLNMNLQVDTSGRIGVYVKTPKFEQRHYNLLRAIPAGIRLTGETIGGYIKDLKLVATPSTGAYRSVGSFIAIGQVFPEMWDWFRFLHILALLSIMLGVMNLLPVPGLDGGHIVFILYEMVSGRKPGEKFLMAAQIFGMVLLLLLMMMAFGNDIGRLIK